MKYNFTHQNQDWLSNSLNPILTESKLEECSPEDCWCSSYDNPYDNYFYSHQHNPAEKYFWWIQEWKKQFQEIHEDCKKLECSLFTDDYVQGVLDSVSPAYPLNNINEEGVDSLFEMDEQLNDEIRQWMTADRN